MKKDAALRDHVLDFLAPLGDVRARAMFGGWGFYHGERFFAIIAEGRLWFKGGPVNLEAFHAAGMEPFRYETSSGTHIMQYYSAPDEALDNPAAMRRWATLALAAADAAKARPRKRRAGS